MFNFYWLELNLPPIPDKFLDPIFNCDSNRRINRSTDRVLKNGDNTYKNGVMNRYQVIDEEFETWIKENIIHEYLAISTQFLEEGTCLGPHLDKWRMYHLFYLIEEGGDGNETVWFREPGWPIFRTDFVVFDDYSKLEELHRTKLPKGKWILFNSKVIHDVVNVNASQRRTSLIIDLPFLPEKFKAQAMAANHYKD